MFILCTMRAARGFCIRIFPFSFEERTWDLIDVLVPVHV